MTEVLPAHDAKAFAERLQVAFGRSSRTPRKSHGRYVWVRDQMEERGIKVTSETVRRWFAGITKPRQHAIDALADVVETDPVWLDRGVETTGTTEEVVEIFAESALRMKTQAAADFIAARFTLSGIHTVRSGHNLVEIKVSSGELIRASVVNTPIDRETWTVTVDIPMPSPFAGAMPLFIVVPNGARSPSFFYLTARLVSVLKPGERTWEASPGRIIIRGKKDGEELHLHEITDLRHIVHRL